MREYDILTSRRHYYRRSDSNYDMNSNLLNELVVKRYFALFLTRRVAIVARTIVALFLHLCRFIKYLPKSDVIERLPLQITPTVVNGQVGWLCFYFFPCFPPTPIMPLQLSVLPSVLSLFPASLQRIFFFSLCAPRAPYRTTNDLFYFHTFLFSFQYFIRHVVPTLQPRTQSKLRMDSKHLRYYLRRC